MDMAEFFKRVDAQIREAAAKEKKPSERRQQQVPVAEDRRSGRDRRGGRRGN